MHGIMGLENLQIVEVQLGWELSEDDIIRSDFIWKNNPCASFPSLASDSSRMPPCIPSTEFPNPSADGLFPRMLPDNPSVRVKLFQKSLPEIPQLVGR